MFLAELNYQRRSGHRTSSRRSGSVVYPETEDAGKPKMFARQSFIVSGEEEDMAETILKARQLGEWENEDMAVGPFSRCFLVPALSAAFYHRGSAMSDFGLAASACYHIRTVRLFSLMGRRPLAACHYCKICFQFNVRASPRDGATPRHVARKAIAVTKSTYCTVLRRVRAGSFPSRFCLLKHRNSSL